MAFIITQIELQYILLSVEVMSQNIATGVLQSELGVHCTIGT